MNKIQFLNELEARLRNSVSKTELDDIIAKYEKQFDQQIAQGRWESAISMDLGAPGLIAKSILEEKHVDELKKMECKSEELASMGKRFIAYLIDNVLLNAVLLVIVYGISLAVSNAWTEVSNYSFLWTELKDKLPFFLFIIMSGFSDFIEAIILWKTNGFTPGKWLLKIQVRKKDSSKLTFGDAFLREVVMKGLASTVTSGCLNIFSLIWAAVTEKKKTVHDWIASTRVMNV